MGPIGKAKRSVNAYVERRLGPTSESLNRLRGDVEAMRDLAQSSAAEAASLGEDVAQLRETVNSLQSVVHMVARRRRPRPVVRCLFLVHYMEAWDSIADVVAQMESAADFEPIVASIPRRLPGSSTFEGEQLTHDRLSRSGVSHIRLVDTETQSLLNLLSWLDPDVVFRQSQWDADVPEAFSTQNLSFARLCLVPYETMNLVENVTAVGGVRDSAADSALHRACWMVFCANERVKDRATEKSWATGAHNWVVTGHPKADRLRSVVTPGPRVAPSPFTVLWSAHHSVDEHWTRFGMFPSVAEEMAAWAEGRPDMKFVFSPHPSLVTMMQASAPPLTTDLVDRFLLKWRRLPNTEVFLGGLHGGYGEVFAESDVLITDGLSFLLEYQLANRPVVFLERDGHQPFNELGDVVRRGVHAVRDVPEAEQIVDAFVRGEPDPLAPEQREVVTELLGNPDSAVRIVEAVRSGMAAERRTG